MLPVGYEEHQWRLRAPEMYSRAEVVRQTGSYESTITRPIAPQHISISSAIGADVEDASRALTDFDTYAQRALGTPHAAIGPMSAILLRTESSSSSQIEQLTTTAKQIALAEIDEGNKSNALLVLGNVRAMEAALRLSESISTQSVLAMHYELLRHSPSLAAHAGKWREEIVWIGGDNAGPRGASFIAPQHELIPQLSLTWSPSPLAPTCRRSCR
nr:Fic/DOC family N-terminal domain-containing protein [Microbacterium sp. NIBRBAC000506063]